MIVLLALLVLTMGLNVPDCGSPDQPKLAFHYPDGSRDNTTHGSMCLDSRDLALVVKW